MIQKMTLLISGVDMNNKNFIYAFLAILMTILFLLSAVPITTRSSSFGKNHDISSEEVERSNGGALNLPVWENGNYWSYRRSARCIDSEGYEYDQWDNHTYTVSSTSEMFTGYGAPVECYNLTLTGDTQNYREAEMDTAEFGFDFGVVPYKTTFSGTVSGHLLVEKSTLATVRDFKALDGSAYIYDLEPAALNAIFSGTYDFWDFNFMNYTPALKDFSFPQNTGDAFHVSSRIDYFTKSHLDIEGGQTRYNSLYYQMEDDVDVSMDDVSMDESDAYQSGNTLSCMKLLYTNNGGEMHSDNPDTPEAPDGGTRTSYISPEVGWYAKYTYNNHFGTLSSGYVIEATEYLKDTNYAGRYPVVENVQFDRANVTNSGDESVLLTCSVADPDGFMDIEKVEADLSGLKIGVVELLDDGTSGDDTAGDDKFSISIDIADSVSTGEHVIDVTVYDRNGNTGSGESTLTVLQKNEAPNVFSGFTHPSKVYNDGLTEVKITAEVDDPNGLDDVVGVSADLHLLGGNGETDMLDDGTNGDTYSSDGKYTVMHIIPISIAPGTYAVEFTATDAGNEVDTLSVDVVVHEYIPVIAPQIIDTECTPEEAFVGPDLEILLTVKIEDGNGLDSVLSVEGDLRDIHGDGHQLFHDDRSNGDKSSGDGIYSYLVSIDEDILKDEGMKEKSFSIPVTVTDDTYETAIGTINFTLKKPNSPPWISSVSASMESVFNDNKEEMTVFVEIIDNDTLEDITGVWIDLSDLGGGQIELDTDTSAHFKTGEYEHTFTVPSTVEGGVYKITLEVEDSAGNRATFEYKIEVVDRYGPTDDDDDTADDDTTSEDDTDDDITDDDEPTDETDRGEEKAESPGFSLFLIVITIGIVLFIGRRIK